MKWKACLFGPFSLVGPDGRLFRTRSKRLKAMIAYLASQPSLYADRRALAHALFDEDDLAWSPNFALLLTRAQTALAAHSELSLLYVTPDEVGLCASSFLCDVKAFAEATQRARHERDSLAACAFWQEALDVARATPFSDLEHPLLSPIRSQLQGMVLEALECLATGPLGQKHAPLILERLAEFGFQRTPSSHRVQALMRIYAALGLKEEVVQTFSSYEAQLDDDCGEQVPSAVSSLFESLLSGMDRPQGRRWGIAPESAPMVGRREHLAALMDLVRDDRGRRLTTLTGQSGIGKSHLLRVLFWRVSPLMETAHFDFELQPPDLVARLLTESTCEVVLLDHVEAEHRHTVEQLLRTHPEARFVCASHTRLGLPGEGMMTLGPLELGDPCTPGPAIELLVRNLERVVDPKATGSPDAQLFEMAELCDGIPMALEIAGRLGGSIGVAATIGSLRRNLDALTSDRGSANRRSSLRNAIESSYRNLGPQAQGVVTLVAGLGGRCHIDHLLECSGAMPCDLEEGLLSGLISRDGTSSYVRVLRSTAAALTSVSEGGRSADLFRRFRERSVDWFARRGEETPLDLQIADSLPVALEIVGQLIGEGAGDHATLLFASIRPWLGSSALGTSQLQAVDRFLLVDPRVEAPGWLPAVLSLSAAYFHAGAFERMRELVQIALEMTPERAAASDQRCQLTMQSGLAERALGHPEAAIERYRQALAEADEEVDESTLVKCYYNLGTLLESQERLDEALAAQEAASDHFTAATDPRGGEPCEHMYRAPALSTGCRFGLRRADPRGDPGARAGTQRPARHRRDPPKSGPDRI
ncbi:MAG: hypothetical protein M9921_09670 [Fimbriimonadaceae bacterium]|nr:hypothetical protein [Fimbriimonadaceae bacterium]